MPLLCGTVSVAVFTYCAIGSQTGTGQDIKCVASVYMLAIKSACAVAGDVWNAIPGTAYAILSCVAPLAGLCALIRAWLVLVHGRKKTPRPGSLGACYVVSSRSG